MATAPASWPHYRRPRLAQKQLHDILDFGVRALTLFGPRGTGKTEFLKQDLMPLAAKAGFRCAYVDLWLVADPRESIIEQLQPGGVTAPVGRTRTLGGDVSRILTPSLGELRVGADMFGTKLEVGAKAKERERHASTDRRLVDAFKTFLKRDKKPILLILDEVQTLASPRHESVIKTVRSILQANDARVARIFTGSSRNGLDRLFRREHAALFQQGGDRINLPPLDRGFVELICDWYAKRTGGHTIDVDAAYRALHALGYSGRTFRVAVERVLLGTSRNITDAAKAVQDAQSTSPQLLAALSKLSPLQAAVLREVWVTGSELYSEASRAGYAALIGADSVSKAEVQAALKRLERMELVYRDGGEWAIESPELDLLLELDASRR